MSSKGTIRVVKSEWKSRKAAKAKKRASKAPSRSKLIKEADTQASLYVRQCNANSEGLVKCYTCPHVTHWKKIHNGHYCPRGLKSVRWDEDNMRPQCMFCNLRRYGNSFIYRENLINEIGDERVKALESRAKLLFRESDEQIIGIAKSFAAKLASLHAEQ